MTVDIRQRLLARPFVPFTIQVADGREYHVPTADHAHVHPNDARVSIYTDDFREFVLPAPQLGGLASDLSHS